MAIASSTCRTRPRSCSTSRTTAWRACGWNMSAAPRSKAPTTCRLAATLRQGEPAPAPVLVASAGKPRSRCRQPRSPMRRRQPSADRSRFRRAGRIISASPRPPGFSDVTAAGRKAGARAGLRGRAAPGVSARAPLRYDSAGRGNQRSRPLLSAKPGIAEGRHLTAGLRIGIPVRARLFAASHPRAKLGHDGT